MKLLLVLALCGVTYCLVGATCSKDYLAKCAERSRKPPGVPGTEEEVLNALCREITCYLDVYDNCGTEIFGKMPFPVKGYTKFIAGLCDKSSPQRQIYLKYFECLQTIRIDEVKNLFKMCGIEYVPRDEYCRKIPDGFRCAVDYVKGKCGEEASEAFKIAALPGFDIYDCLSS